MENDTKTISLQENEATVILAGDIFEQRRKLVEARSTAARKGKADAILAMRKQLVMRMLDCKKQKARLRIVK